MSLTLYTTPDCEYCEQVRDELARRGLAYDEVAVPLWRSQREEIFRLSGQRKVPVLVDGDTVVADSARILEHLARRYPAAAQGGETWRHRPRL